VELRPFLSKKALFTGVKTVLTDHIYLYNIIYIYNTKTLFEKIDICSSTSLRYKYLWLAFARPHWTINYSITPEIKVHGYVSTYVVLKSYFKNPINDLRAETTCNTTLQGFITYQLHKI
jgi:hypothetical protein